MGHFYPMGETNMLAEKKPFGGTSSGTFKRSSLIEVQAMPDCWDLEGKEILRTELTL